VLYTAAVIGLLVGDTAQAEASLPRAANAPDAPARAHAALGYYLAAHANADGARQQLTIAADAIAAADGVGDIDLLYWAAMAQTKIGDAQEAGKLTAVLTGRWPKHPLTVNLTTGK